jgi:hypothetical protein
VLATINRPAESTATAVAAKAAKGGHCVFRTEQPPRMPAAPSTDFCAASAVAAAIADSLPRESRVWAKAFAATRRCPSVRIHLWQQVLLL